MERNVQRKILIYAPLLLVALAAQPAHAQWFPYPGPVVGGLFHGSPVATVRTRVTPRETQVFVDGYAAGPVDDFDGVFQRLQLVPGQHEITLYLPGYQTYRENIYLNPGSSHDVRHTMVTRPAGEADDPAPVPRGPGMAGGVGGPGAPAPGMPQGPMTLPAPETAPAPGATQYGVLALRVQPGDARVMIDGEEWRSSQPQDRLSLQVNAGRHQLTIEKAGFQTFTGDVDVKAGETSTLNVSLIAK